MTKRRKLLLGTAVLGVLLIGGFITWSMQGNDGAKIINASDNTDQNGPAFKQFNGKYMSFSYKSVYDAQSVPARDSDLEITTLTAYNGFQKTLAVAVTDFTSGLDFNSAYKLRSAQTDVYERRDIRVQDAPAIEFFRRDGTEITIFIPNGKVLTSLAFVSNGGQENLVPEVDAVLASYRWK